MLSDQISSRRVMADPAVETNSAPVLRPINSARRVHGEWIIAYDPALDRAAWPTAPFVIATWSEDIRCFCDEEGYPIDPTRWCPLPERPTQPDIIEGTVL